MNEGSLDDIHNIALYAGSYFDTEFPGPQPPPGTGRRGEQISYKANKTLLKGTMESIFACASSSSSSFSFSCATSG